jgi:hypothetical protein
LIAAGHPPAVVWSYTPRQLHGFVALARRRRLTELRENLVVSALGAQGDDGAVERQLREWSDDG